MPTALQSRVLRLLEFNLHLSQRDAIKVFGGEFEWRELLFESSDWEMFGQNTELQKKSKQVGICLLTPQVLAEKTDFARAFLKRKIHEYLSLDEEIEALSCEVGQLLSTDIDEASLLCAAEPSEVGQASRIGY